MDFGTCKQCNSYNYLERDGLCGSCAPSRDLAHREVHFTGHLTSKPSLSRLETQASNVQDVRNLDRDSTRATEHLYVVAKHIELRIAETGSIKGIHTNPTDVPSANQAVTGLLGNIVPSTPSLSVETVQVELELDGIITDPTATTQTLQQYNPNLVARTGGRVVVDDPNITDIDRVAVSGDAIVLHGSDRDEIEAAINNSSLLEDLDKHIHS